MTGHDYHVFNQLAENLIKRALSAERDAEAVSKSDPMRKNFLEGTGNGLRLAVYEIKDALYTLNKAK